MKENYLHRIILRFASLSVLVLGVIFFASDQPQYTTHASDYPACDSGFNTCNSGCGPGNAVPCYGNCQTSYFNCLYDAGDEYSRTPLTDPNQSCWDNAVSIYNHCLIGNMPLGQGYGNTYANCMATTNDVTECCTEVQSEWWAINGPWCY